MVRQGAAAFSLEKQLAGQEERARAPRTWAGCRQKAGRREREGARKKESRRKKIGDEIKIDR